MDLLTRMSQALAYVEENLTGEIDHEALARIACCSSYNFHRMFSFMTEISLSEYIRRRKLTLAAIELQNGNIKVIDLALKYGYDSPVSFARAFQTLHGVTPTEARAGGATLKAYPKISFQISIKGEKEMDYRIETKEAFQVFGIEGIFRTDGTGEPPKRPSDLWDQCHANGEYKRLEENAGDLPGFVSKDMCKVHAVCSYRKVPEGSFPYMICAFRSPNSRVDGYTVIDIPSYTWAIFPSKKFKWPEFGDVIENLYKRFFSEWLPTAEYEQVEGLDFEVYGGDDELGYVELWFAVRKKM